MLQLDSFLPSIICDYDQNSEVFGANIDIVLFHLFQFYSGNYDTLKKKKKSQTPRKINHPATPHPQILLTYTLGLVSGDSHCYTVN